MPNLANITVKKNDGTTDVVYTGVIASAGDKTPAVWRSNSVGAASAFRPELRLSSESNASKTVRRLTETYSYPVTVTGSDGKVAVAHRATKTTTWTVPTEMPDTDVAEFVSQSAALDVSALIKDCIKSGYSAT